MPKLNPHLLSKTRIILSMLVFSTTFLQKRSSWGVWRIGRVDAFHPKGHGFDSRSSSHIGTLGKSFTQNCLWRFGVKFRHSICAESGAPLSSSGIEKAL